MKALLALRAPPTAIIGLGTHILSAALRAVYDAGLSVPRDLSVIGIGTSHTLEFAHPPMTMLRFDLDENGRTAAELILDRIKLGNTSPYLHIIKPMELVIASSCAPPRLPELQRGDSAVGDEHLRIDKRRLV